MLVTLVPFVISKHQFKLGNLFTGLVDDLWEVVKILIQEWGNLDLVWVVYPTLNLVRSYLISSLLLSTLRRRELPFTFSTIKTPFIIFPHLV